MSETTNPNLSGVPETLLLPLYTRATRWRGIFTGALVEADHVRVWKRKPISERRG